jgi:hypothetical protein
MQLHTGALKNQPIVVTLQRAILNLVHVPGLDVAAQDGVRPAVARELQGLAR